MLADHLQAGKILNGHDDVPENFRRLVMDNDREREVREQKQRDKERKRKRRDSVGSSAGLTAIHCHRYATGCTAIATSSSPILVFPTSPLMEFGFPREDAVRVYSAW
jgi:hypothetical protein